MLILWTFLSIWACTFVACNQKMQEGSRTSFFVVYVIVTLLFVVLFWLLS